MRRYWPAFLSAVILLVLPFLWAFFTWRPDHHSRMPLAEYPQDMRCAVMVDWRDLGRIGDLKDKTREEVRAILGDPQNSDEDADVWIWIFDWAEYHDLPTDWRTIAANAPGDGLWIHFESDRCAMSFPISISASDPLEVLREE